MAPKIKPGKQPRPKKKHKAPPSTDQAAMNNGDNSQPRSSTHPWPRVDGTPIEPEKTWDIPNKRVVKRVEYIDRPLLEHWSVSDTLFYNAWLQNVSILPTRFVDKKFLKHMGIEQQVAECWERIGLGHMGYKEYVLYPDLVIQFFASVSIYYTNAVVPNAQQGTMTFMIQGVHYRITMRQICDVFGFNADGKEVSLPGHFEDSDCFWSKFGQWNYHSKDATHSDIRHPVLRYLGKMIANTILCKMEPVKMRVEELILFHYAVGHLCEEDYSTSTEKLSPVHTINFGAVFAHHLVSLKTKGLAPSTGPRDKREWVGSLLTPLFEAVGVDLTHIHFQSTLDHLDEQHFRDSKIINKKGLYTWRDGSKHYGTRLPLPEHTSISTQLDLSFAPPRDLVSILRPPRSSRGVTSAAGPSTRQNAMGNLIGDPSEPRFIGLVPADFSPYEAPPLPADFSD